MKTRLLPLLFAGLALAPAPRAAERGADTAELVISASASGYAYWNIADRLRKVAAEEKLGVEVLESVGSLQNLERLEDPKSPVNLALAQSDALDQFLESHAALRSRLDIVESVGVECVYLIARADSPVQTDADMARARDFRIAIPGIESGVAATYRALAALVPGFAVTRPVYRDGIGGILGSLTAQGPERADAVMLVLRPKRLPAEVQEAVDHPESYRFVAIPQKKLPSNLPDGQPTYSFIEAPLVRRGNAVERSVPTVCTKGLLVASRAKMASQVKRRLGALVDERWMSIYADED
jgi:hypothetical protein